MGQLPLFYDFFMISMILCGEPHAPLRIIEIIKKIIGNLFLIVPIHPHYPHNYLTHYQLKTFEV